MISTRPRPSSLVFLVAATILLGGMLSACGGDDEKSKDAEVVNPQLVRTPSGERVFAGTLVNGSTASITVAEVEVALYNAEGSRIETMRIQVEDIAPEDSTEFSKPIASTRPIQQAQVQQILIP